MATNVQNASAVMDALADYLGKTLTAQQKLDWAERFIDDIGGADDNETKAGKMLETLVNYVRATGAAHVKLNAERTQEAANQATADAVAAEL